MKRLILYITALFLLRLALAAGRPALFSFSNSGIRGGDPFYDEEKVRLVGTNYAARCYVGASWEMLVPIGPPALFSTGFGAGTFHAGEFLVLTNRCEGQDAWVQVRAWDTRTGSSFERAAANGGWTGVSQYLYIPELMHQCFPNPCTPSGLMGLRYPGNPLVVYQPTDQSVRSGGRAQLRVVASGSIATSYQWYEGQVGTTNQPVTGATNDTMTTPAVTASTLFWCRITTAISSTDSQAATVRVNSYPADAPYLFVRQNDNHPTWWIDGPTNTPFRLEYRDELLAPSWKPLLDLSLEVSPQPFVDPSTNEVAQRFYRVLKR